MEIKKFLSFIILLILLLFSPIYAEGIDLCNSVFSYLQKENFNPIKQNLLSTGENTFPFNVVVNIDSEEKASKNLILVFFQEDVLGNENVISDSITKIKDSKYQFNISILFAYGEKQIFSKQGMIFGTQVYLDSINTNEDFSAIIIDLMNEENSVITKSDKITSPSWLIQNSYNIYTEQNIDNKIPTVVLSQLSSFNFFEDKCLSRFFDKEIPAIKLNLKDSKENKEIALNVVSQSVEKYSQTPDRVWDFHFVMIRLFRRYFKLSEINLLRIIIVIIFFWVCFIFLFFFVNRHLQKRAWNTIKNIWYLVPGTFFISIFSFILGKVLYQFFFYSSSDIRKIFTLLSVQLVTVFFFISAFYALILLLNYKYEEKSIDYLLVFSCFINQSLFILFDISLCPIFIVICFFSILAITLKDNFIHIVIFALMMLPFYPYISTLLSDCDISLLSRYVFSSKTTFIILPLVFYPSMLIYFRILTSLKIYFNNTRKTVISVSVFFVIFTIFTVSFLIVQANTFSAKLKPPVQITMKNDAKDFITLSYSDKQIFDDTIRTVFINLKDDVEMCEVQIKTDRNNPILYTDNDYTIASNGFVAFTIPNNPPKNMSFSYGTAKTPSIITVSVIYKSGDSENREQNYNLQSKSITTGAF